MKKEYEIYTDGACVGNGQSSNIGGWGFVVIQNDELFFESCKSVENTTNNAQEITAVIMALNYCDENGIKEFNLFSDSQYVVKGFNEWMHNWKIRNWHRGKKENPEPIKNIELWKSLYSFWDKYQHVKLNWVKGHNGNKWNEYVDEIIHTKAGVPQDDKINYSTGKYFDAELTDISLMPFGKYKGIKMANIPADYLLWLLGSGKCNGNVKNYILSNREYLANEVMLERKMKRR